MVMPFCSGDRRTHYHWLSRKYLSRDRNKGEGEAEERGGRAKEREEEREEGKDQKRGGKKEARKRERTEGREEPMCGVWEA